jgi:neutral ceramidase
MAESAEAFALQLSSLGLRPGTTAVFESPATQLAAAAALLAAWQALLGPEGTLVVPTCTDGEGYPKPTFDPALSPSEAGAFSEFFRVQPGVLRSHNPTHSVAALGQGAEQITAGHRTALGRPTPWGDNPFGHGSPWDILAQRDAWWVALDADWDRSPFLAYLGALIAEQEAGITKAAPFPRLSGKRLMQALAAAGLLRETSWRRRRLVAFRLDAAIRQARALWQNEPERLGLSEEVARWLATLLRLRAEGPLLGAGQRVAITPPIPCLRWDGKTLQGVYRDLYARILVLRHGEQQLVLIACDLLGIARYLVEDLRQRVEAATGVPGSRLMVACTHAHSTPDTIGSGNADPAYLDHLVASLAQGVSSALAALQPVRVGWGRVPARGLAHSRRVRLTDGSVFTTRYGVPSTWRVRPELIAGAGDSDPDITLLRVETLDGSVLAAVTNFACHPSVALMSPNISGDYLGEAAYALEQALGQSAVVLCTNGSAADVDPTLEMPFWGPRNDANALRLGRIFAGQVLESLERIAVGDETSLAVARVPVDLPVRPDWLHLLQAEQARLAQEFASVQIHNPVIDPILAEGIIHTEVQALRINDLRLLGLPGEVMTSTGRKIKTSEPQSAVLELANDNVGYLLTPEAAAEGGYETGLHLWTRVPAEAEAILLGAVRQALSALQEEPQAVGAQARGPQTVGLG